METITRVNDRGPFASEREIDVSYRAAQELDFLNRGTLLAYLDVIPICS